MKKFFRFAVCAFLIIALVIANICVSSAADKFFSKTDMLLIKNHIEDDADANEYANIQGACTDGKYAYFALMQSGTTIMKYNISSWEFVEKKKVSNVGHANDMTYNPDKGYIVIANNAPYYDRLTLLDPDTLKVIKDVQIDEDIYSIAYNASMKRYIVGLSGGYDFAMLDEDFDVIRDEDKVKEKEELEESDKKEDREKAEKLNTTKIYEGVSTGYTRQGCDCDGDYIYFVQSGGNNLLVIYDYSGNHIASIPMASKYEVENILHIGNTFYTTTYHYGNRLYRIGFNSATDISYKVSYDPAGGEGEMEPTTVHYGKSTKLRKNEFKREGYTFYGWRVQRDSDDKVIGYRLGSDKYEWLSEDDLYTVLPYFDEESMAETVLFGNLKLSAIWINDEYGIDFDTDGGVGEMEPAVAKYDGEFVIPENGFSKEGYVFSGFSAVRDLDGRTYGYREGSDEPEWLKSDDIIRPHLFRPGDKVTKLTTDGRVNMTARYKFAYTFGDDGSTLVEYVGVDEKVYIPDNSGELKTLAEGAIKDNETMTELYIPAGVNDLQKQAVTNCPKLRSIYFEGSLPEKFDPDGVSGADTPAVYKVRDGQAFCIGFYADEASASLIRCHAASLDRALKANMLTR